MDCIIKEAGSRYCLASTVIKEFIQTQTTVIKEFIQTQTVELDMVFGHPLQFSLPRAKEGMSSLSGKMIDGIVVMSPTLELTGSYST